MLRERPWIVIISAPASSHIRANSAANISFSFIPVRHFTVTTFPLFFTARITAAALGISSIIAQPSPALNTFGTGQPILISIMSNFPNSSLAATASITAGLPPRSCAALIFPLRSLVSKSLFVAISRYFNELALAISVKLSPAPSSFAKMRNGRQVYPASGAIRTLDESSRLPTRSGFISISPPFILYY